MNEIVELTENHNINLKHSRNNTNKESKDTIKMSPIYNIAFLTYLNKFLM
jgi:hypothetical protein